MVVGGRFKQDPVFELSAKKSSRSREVTDSGEVADGGEVADSGEVAISGVLAVSGEGLVEKWPISIKMLCRDMPL